MGKTCHFDLTDVDLSTGGFRFYVWHTYASSMMIFAPELAKIWAKNMIFKVDVILWDFNNGPKAKVEEVNKND